MADRTGRIVDAAVEIARVKVWMEDMCESIV